MKLSKIIALILFLFISNKAIKAQDHGHEDSHHSNNHLAVFLGSTYSTDAEHSSFTVGLDYEYRLPILHNKLGIGIFGEVILEEHHNAYAFGIPVFFHPIGGLKLFAAPALEAAKYAEGTEEEKWHSHFGVRVGVAYDFHVGKISISPTFAYDYINEHGFIITGVSFGIGF